MIKAKRKITKELKDILYLLGRRETTLVFRALPVSVKGSLPWMHKTKVGVGKGAKKKQKEKGGVVGGGGGGGMSVQKEKEKKKKKRKKERKKERKTHVWGVNGAGAIYQ